VPLPTGPVCCPAATGKSLSRYAQVIPCCFKIVAAKVLITLHSRKPAYLLF
jgi:hypothetical protein